MGFFSKGLKNEFETSVVDEPSVSEPLKFCIYILDVQRSSYVSLVLCMLFSTGESVPANLHGWYTVLLMTDWNRTIHRECPYRIRKSHPRDRNSYQGQGLPNPWVKFHPEGEIYLSYIDWLLMDYFSPTFKPQIRFSNYSGKF